MLPPLKRGQRSSCQGAHDEIIAAVRALSPAWEPDLEGHWRSAITSIIVPMIEGAAVHTAIVAERIASDAAAIE